MMTLDATASPLSRYDDAPPRPVLLPSRGCPAPSFVYAVVYIRWGDPWRRSNGAGNDWPGLEFLLLRDSRHGIAGGRGERAHSNWLGPASDGT
jgi:hypothetical protein